MLSSGNINTTSISGIIHQNIENNTISNIINNSNNSIDKMRSDYLQTINSNYMVNNMINNNISCYSQSNVTQNNPIQSNDIKMDLEDKELWTRFYNLNNEMILTKAGRRTFPLVKIRLSGMDESALYTVQIEFKPSDNFKYRFVNGEWKTSPKNENFKQAQQSIIYEHPDSPNFGHHWSKDSVAFGKLKLTNNENSKNVDAVFLKSLNKYDPIIHIYKHDKKNVDDKVLLFSKFFKETQFIAVTAYQNEQITNLKIKHNPFAKAFLNNKPIITIDNDKIISVEQPVKKQILDVQQIQTNDQKVNNIKPNQQPQQNYQNNNISNNSKNFMVQNTFLNNQTKQEPSEIFNWYNYYQQTSPIQNQYQYQNNQPFYPQSSYDFNYTTQNVYNQYVYPNEFLYQNQYNQIYAQNHSEINYQENLSNYYPIQYDYNILNDSERTKQSSPIYDLYPKISQKRTSTEMLKDNTPVPYQTCRPSKRQAVENGPSSSPVYNQNINKIEYHEQSDDSLNSSENYLHLQLNQNNQSSSSSSSSFALSTSNASA